MQILLDHGFQLAAACGLTFMLFVGTLAIGSVTGLFVGIARNSSIKVMYVAATAYSWFWRVMPVLLVLYFVYYGLPAFKLTLSAMATALLTIGLSSGAYMGEIVRGGLASVPASQREAAGSLGMGPVRTFRRVVLPYVLRSTAGPYVSQAIMVLKGTSLASLIGLSELTQVTRGLINATYTVWPFLLFSAAAYLALSLVLTQCQRLAEEKWSW